MDIFQEVRETEYLFSYLFKSREFEYESNEKTLRHPYVVGAEQAMLATYRHKLSPERFVSAALNAGVLMARFKFIEDDDDLIEKGDYLVYMEDVIDHPNKGGSGKESFFGGTSRGISCE